MKKLILFVVLMMSIIVNAMDIKVGLFGNIKAQGFSVKIDTGEYAIYDGNVLIMSAFQNDRISFEKTGDKILFYYNNEEFGRMTKPRVVSVDSFGVFKVRSTSPENDVHTFDDNFLVRIEQNFLRGINEVNLEKYLAGVLEAEVGHFYNVEFLKTQAVLCRTYALRQMLNSNYPNYDICDFVQCQVYRGKNRFNMTIGEAVAASKGFIVTDVNNALIDAVFHSNSGGQTANSEDVWGGSLSYLRSVEDTFSLAGNHACWQLRLSEEEWQKYLNKSFGMETVNWNTLDSIRYEMSTENEDFNPLLVRKDWRVQSDRFVVSKEDDWVVLEGQGFGHRVGLSQEGAHRMAELGYSFEAIIKHYYSNVEVIDLDTWRN
ncbi:MAG: stage II sporulation protein D [Sphingobacteriales bacterium]|jgi:stage II sporulation protein D